jgi:hypothetical protein
LNFTLQTLGVGAGAGAAKFFLPGTLSLSSIKIPGKPIYIFPRKKPIQSSYKFIVILYYKVMCRGAGTIFYSTMRLRPDLDLLKLDTL